MSAEVFRTHMNKLNECLADGEKMLVRNTDSFANIMEDFATDLRIVCTDMILPCHKYILSSRCDVLAKVLSTGVDELDWTSYESNISIVLLRWFYTDKVVSDNDTVTLGLLRAAYYLALPTLFEACEQKLLSSINENCSRDLYKTAKEVNAEMLIRRCVERSSTLVDDISSKQQMQIDIGDNGDSLSYSDIDLGKLDNPLREEVMEIFRRKEKLDVGCSKLGKSLVGVKKFMHFFDTTIWSWPAHKYILLGRSEKLQDLASNTWSGLKRSNEFALVRWLYTNVVCLDSIDVALALLEASHKYDLHSLFVICEEAIIKLLSVTTCAQVHITASKVSATKALEKCEGITAQYWDCIKSELSEVAADGDNPEAVKATTSDEQNAVVQPGTLLTLNDDCLLHLLRFIPLVDLGSIKDTCKRLNLLASRSFQLYGNKSLTIRRSSMVADLWKLKHFGKYIDSLTLESLYQEYCSWTDVLMMIGRFSNEKLQSISLCVNYNKSVTVDSLKCLENVVKNVKIIELDAFDNGSVIESLLGLCQNLQELHINSEELELNTLWCSKNENIKSVTLKDLNNDDVLDEMCETLVHLESFSFNIEDITDKLNQLCRLDHLKQLKIEYFDENAGTAISALLRKLVERNLLEHLSIFSPYVVEETAHAICDFPKLRELVFEGTAFEDNIISILSEKLNNVEKLTFLSCDQITFEDISKIIMNTLNLNELTVSGCELVDVIEKQQYLRLRKRRNLYIYLDAEAFEKTIKLLANDLSDYVKIAAVATD